MKGVILAGGTGSRLLPLTRSTNKHLLPVGPVQMIIHCVNKLTAAEIKDILVVTGVEHMSDMIRLLGSGRQYDCEITYRVQDESLGIAHALYLARDFCSDSKFVVLLGDNIFEDDLLDSMNTFKKSNLSGMIFLKEVSNPERYGVAVLNDKKTKIIKLVEKPTEYISNLCVTGIYMYTSAVFDIIKSIKPSKRGEYEISCVNDEMRKLEKCGFTMLEGWWTDAGTMKSYKIANELVWKSV